MKLAKKAVNKVKGTVENKVLEKMKEKLDQTDAIHLFSTYLALISGVTDGFIEADDLRNYGDTGFGFFHKINSLMIMLDGKVYKIDGEGYVEPAGRGAMIPFAATTFFEKNFSRSDIDAKDKKSLEKLVRPSMEANGKNMFYAAVLDGTFSEIRLDSYCAAAKKYNSVPEHLKDTRNEYSLTNVEGTFVGFYFPVQMQGVTEDGWHFLFISKDLKRGGHVKDFTDGKGKIWLDVIRRIYIELPNTTAYNKLEIGPKVEEAEETE